MLIGRLQPGVTRSQALAQLTPAFLRAAYLGVGTRDPKERSPRLHLSSARGIAGGVDSDASQPLGVLMAMVGVVLLIACTNIAMLIIARNTAREREFSLRMALGAGRSHIFRQLLTESVLLVGGGAALGWIFAAWGGTVLALGSGLDVGLAPDSTVLFFALALALLAALPSVLADFRNAVLVPRGLAHTGSTSTACRHQRKVRASQIVVAL